MRPCARLAPVLLVLVLSGCPARDISSLGHGDNGEISNEPNVVTNRKVDVLFLVDNSSSMDDKQDVVAAAFPRFIDVLNTIPGGLPDLHIGVASSTVSVGWPGIDGCETPDDGLLQNTPRLCRTVGTACRFNSECCSYSCSMSTGKCAAGAGRAGCHVPGDTCSSDNDCCTHECTGGTCGCPVPNAGARYIEYTYDVNNTPHPNFSGNLADVFTCIARLGVEGCGYEQHLEGMLRALNGSRPENSGFVRTDAYLAVVILADEDDCSAKDTAVFNPDTTQVSTLGPQGSFRCTEFGVQCDGKDLSRTAADYMTCTPRTDSYMSDPQHYVDELRRIKGGDLNRVLVAAIAGDTKPFGVTVTSDGFPQLKHSDSCRINGHDNVADPAVRLQSFVNGFEATHRKFISICAPNYGDALAAIADLIAKKVGVPCLGGAIDTTDINPSEPGLQLDCQVSDAPAPGSTLPETVLPRCPMTAADTPNTTVTPCWWTTIDASTCPSDISETNTKLVVERGNAAPPPDTTVVARCASKE